MTSVERIKKLTRLLEYPNVAGWMENLNSLLDEPTTHDGLIALRNFSQAQREELFTETFDLNPSRTLSLAYHALSGDESRWMRCLTELQGEYNKHPEWTRDLAVNASRELPDHAPLLLEFLAGLQDGEERRLLASHLVIPGLEGLLKSFGDDVAIHPFAAVVEGLLIEARRLVPC